MLSNQVSVKLRYAEIPSRNNPIDPSEVICHQRVEAPPKFCELMCVSTSTIRLDSLLQIDSRSVQ